ncbi:MAG: 4-hydroxy-tetrahydrodipicolinate reductase [Bacteroidales bacterium]|nr:4-hydroxy-tetrahydrodipicolinate reductase [Bacteroidales bacterium]
MKIAIIGYGKMGKEIERLANSNQIEVTKIIDIQNHQDIFQLKKIHTDVAIEFTQPTSAIDNIKICFEQNIPIVCGTTGWYEHMPTIKQWQKKYNGTLFYASNFSIGVNLYMKIIEYSTKLMNQFIGQYHIYIEETHHTQKKDSPSGTALTLSNIVMNQMKQFNKIENYLNQDVQNHSLSHTLPIYSYRKDSVIGEHKLTFESDVDSITLTHNAKNRTGFALGAIKAAEYLINQPAGIYTMNNLIK